MEVPRSGEEREAHMGRLLGLFSDPAHVPPSAAELEGDLEAARLYRKEEEEKRGGGGGTEMEMEMEVGMGMGVEVERGGFKRPRVELDIMSVLLT